MRVQGPLFSCLKWGVLSTTFLKDIANRFAFIVGYSFLLGETYFNIYCFYSVIIFLLRIQLVHQVEPK